MSQVISIRAMSAVEAAVNDLQVVAIQLIRFLHEESAVETLDLCGQALRLSYGFKEESLAAKLNECYRHHAEHLSAHGDHALAVFNCKCADVQAEMHRQYNEAAISSLTMIVKSLRIELQTLLPTFTLPASSHLETVRRALETFERELVVGHSAAVASSEAQLRVRMQGWTVGDPALATRCAQISSQLHRDLADEVSSRRQLALSKVHGIFDMSSASSSSRELHRLESGSVAAEELVESGRKRKADIRRGEFIAGTPVVSETPLQRSKREAEAALQARLAAYASNRNTSSPGVETTAGEIKQSASGASARGDGIDAVVEPETDCVSKAEKVPRAVGTGRSRVAPVVVKSARAAVRKSPVPRNLRASQKLSVEAAKAAAAADIQRRTSNYKPVAQGGGEPERKKRQRTTAGS